MTIATARSLPRLSETPVSIRKSERVWPLLGCAGFVLLAWWQIAHHAMWRDELQAWEIAVASRSPWDLFGALHYEGHPGLWYLLLWLATFVTTDPHAMQGIQGLVAAGLVACVWLLMPFRSVQKLLISCSYFLVFEYTVMSRSYGLGVLLTFLAMTCWQSSSEEPGLGRRLLPWALLGLAVNVSLYNALLAVVLGGWRLWTIPAAGPRGRMAQVPGLGVLGLLTAVAVATLWPAADVSTAQNLGENWSDQRVFDAEIQVVRTFLPINDEVGTRFWEPIPFHDLSIYLLATIPILWLAARAVGNDRPRIFAIVAVVGGTALLTLAVYPAAIRHTGMAFIVFLLMAWDACGRGRLKARSFAVILAFNAVGGAVAMQGAAARPFSRAEAVADWFRSNDLQQAFIAGTPAPYASAVAGYLRRPIYYLDRGAVAAFLVWRHDPRFDRLATQPLGERLVQVMGERRLDRVYLVRAKKNGATDPIADPGALGLAVSLLASFDGAADTDENYEIFRVDRLKPAS